MIEVSFLTRQRPNQIGIGQCERAGIGVDVLAKFCFGVKKQSPTLPEPHLFAEKREIVVQLAAVRVRLFNTAARDAQVISMGTAT